MAKMFHVIGASLGGSRVGLRSTLPILDASHRRESGQLRGPFTGHAEWKSKRIIAVNVQGITRKKKDFTSLPLAKIQAFSVETAGTFDLDAELELWFSGLGKVKFEFSGKTDVAYLNKLVAHHVL